MTHGHCESCAAWECDWPAATFGTCVAAQVSSDAGRHHGLPMALWSGGAGLRAGVGLLTRPEHGCLAWKQRPPPKSPPGYDANGSPVES